MLALYPSPPPSRACVRQRPIPYSYALRFRPSSPIFFGLHNLVAFTLTSALLGPLLATFVARALSRSLGLMEAVRSLETSTGSEINGDHNSIDGLGNGRGGCGGEASTVAHLDVETLPDVPGEVSMVSCKVQERRISHLRRRY